MTRRRTEVPARARSRLPMRVAAVADPVTASGRPPRPLAPAARQSTWIALAALRALVVGVAIVGAALISWAAEVAQLDVPGDGAGEGG